MKLFLILFLSFFMQISAIAESMSIETHTALIQKLQSVVGFSEESVSKQNMVLRLADLYSERARMYAMANEGKGDIQYKKEISKDRLAALALYEKAFLSAEATKKGPILLQMAHLQQLLKNKKKSIQLYQEIIAQKNRHDPLLVAQAQIEAGDFEYNKQNFKIAQRYFRAAILVSGASRLSYARYRIAWCEFHEGKTESAITNLRSILKNPDAFKKSDGSVDKSFQEEASRDLATFLARRNLKPGDIESIVELSPENARESNLTYLATELDRTGKKKSALQVWAVIGKNNPSSENQLEGQIKITKIQYDLGKKSQTVVELKKAIEMLKNESCEDPGVCASYKQQIRKLVTDWGQAEEVSPSLELIQAYKAYAFEYDDIEMAYWGAIAAQKKKQWLESFNLFKKSSELSYTKIREENKKTKDQNITALFEGSLLGVIDSAEQSQDINLRNQAYAHYLNLNPEGKKALEVEYQIAQVLLEQKIYIEAAEKFKKIAYSEKKEMELKNKAADLALDTLVLLKNDATLETWANDFSRKFPKRRQEFLAISRKAVLNQAAQVINTTDSNSSLENQYQKLSQTDLSKATPEERALFYKHRNLIAIKTQNLNATIATSLATLSSKGIPAKEKNEALKQLAWAYEMKMDFKNAYKTLKKINSGDETEHQLKLGVIAELANQNPKTHFENYLKHSPNKTKKQTVALALIRISSQKMKDFNKYKSLLRDNSHVYLTAGLYAYDENKSETLRSELLSQKNARNTFEGQLLLRQIQIERIQKDLQEIAAHKLEAKNQRKLSQSIQKRISLLSSLERKTQNAIESKDFTLQFVTLSIVEKENSRIARDILKLPAPRGLNKKQTVEYKKLVSQQIEPYLQRAKHSQIALRTLWEQREESSFEDVLELSLQNKTPGNKAAKLEVQVVKKTAARYGYAFEDVAKKRQQWQKTSQQLSNVKSKVKTNPFDSSYLQEMKSLEEKLNHGPMVAYLDARLMELKADLGGRN